MRASQICKDARVRNAPYAQDWSGVVLVCIHRCVVRSFFMHLALWGWRAHPLNASGKLVSAFSALVPNSLREVLGESVKKTIIFEAEVVALICAMRRWRGLLSGKPTLFFVDNNTARDIAISGPLGHPLPISCWTCCFLTSTLRRSLPGSRGYRPHRIPPTPPHEPF